ncbi:MAG: T9SS type A sorting domain-containing protein [Candidatus Marinimicrobia bacterium]|nr:T9SS type A sorting domain-containing protein [Candidatus Neomarinimicrobiota bacterium]
MRRMHRSGLYHTFTGLIIALSLGTATRAQTLEQDSLALVALYNSTGGANWTDNSGWLEPDSALASWYGVTISNGRVDELRLRDNNLSGTIPAEIGDLTALQLLYLGNDSLTGSIPTAIGNLASLTDLSIINSQISGPIPTEIGNLTNLGTISLVGNQLTGSIPSSIGNLVGLSYLMLEGNQLTGAIPGEIGNLVNLTRFSAWENALSDTIPPGIGNLTSLITLSLSSNQLTGSIPPEIGNDTSLTWLNLSDNQLTGPIPGEIGKLTRLDNLYLNANKLSGTLPPEIGNLTSCIYLYLQINNLSGPIPAQISGLISLTNLELGSNEFTSLPPEISNLTGLESLSLSFNQLDSLPDFSPMSSLSLFLVDNNQLTFEDVIPLLGLSIGYIQYAPQDSVGTALDTIIDVGASITLSVDVGGVGNLYTWKRGFNVELNQSTTNFYTISNATVSDAGVYHCEISNPGADQLMLISRTMQIGVGGPLAADGPANLPEEYALHPNYPNPFNPVTTIRFELPRSAKTVLLVYDIVGQEVVRLVDEVLSPGYHKTSWNGKDRAGRKVASGIYIAKLTTPDWAQTMKMILLK